MILFDLEMTLGNTTGEERKQIARRYYNWVREMSYTTNSASHKLDLLAEADKAAAIFRPERPVVEAPVVEPTVYAEPQQVAKTGDKVFDDLMDMLSL